MVQTTYVAEQLLFSMLLLNSSNKRAIFFSILGQKIGYFEGWGHVQIVLGSTHIVQQFLFSLFPSILKFDFD